MATSSASWTTEGGLSSIELDIYGTIELHKVLITCADLPQ